MTPNKGRLRTIQGLRPSPRAPRTALMQLWQSRFAEDRTDSFDHLVGAGEQRLRHGEAERLRGLQVENQLEFAGLIDREIARIGSAQNPIRGLRQPASKIAEFRGVSGQPTCLRVVAIRIYRSQLAPVGEIDNQLPVRQVIASAAYDQRIAPNLDRFGDCSL